MGSTQSYISAELAVALVVVAGALGLGYSFRATSQPLPLSTEAQKASDSKNKKKKKAAGSSILENTVASTTPSTTAAPQVVSFPDIIPGQFDTPDVPEPLVKPQTSENSKAKKKKNKKAKDQGAQCTTPISNSPVEQPQPQQASGKPTKPKAPKSGPKSSHVEPTSPLHKSSASIDTDESWTCVESSRRAGGSANQQFEATTSDAGLTTSVTGNSSPVVERTEDELFSPNPRDSGESRRTLAEKLLPKARKTGVEDLLDTPDVPTLSRVMRIKPGPDEKPASGFSWADYEDVRVIEGRENDAEGEDDGWGVVKSRKSKSDRPPSSTATQPRASNSSTTEGLTKQQRQNAQKRDATKAAKAEAEADRLAALARHKRELERLRIAEQFKKTSGKTVSGGMQASVQGGKLVWE